MQLPAGGAAIQKQGGSRDEERPVGSARVNVIGGACQVFDRQPSSASGGATDRTKYGLSPTNGGLLRWERSAGGEARIRVPLSRLRGFTASSETPAVRQIYATRLGKGSPLTTHRMRYGPTCIVEHLGDNQGSVLYLSSQASVLSGGTTPSCFPRGASECGCNQVAMNIRARLREESSLHSPNRTKTYETGGTL
jgi:hypothetical protein